MNDGSKFFAAFLAGAAVGAVLGILYAPASGAETRQNLAEGASRIGDQIREKAEEGMSYVGSLKEKASSKISGMMKNQEGGEYGDTV